MSRRRTCRWTVRVADVKVTTHTFLERSKAGWTGSSGNILTGEPRHTRVRVRVADVKITTHTWSVPDGWLGCESTFHIKGIKYLAHVSGPRVASSSCHAMCAAHVMTPYLLLRTTFFRPQTLYYCSLYAASGHTIDFRSVFCLAEQLLWKLEGDTVRWCGKSPQYSYCGARLDRVAQSLAAFPFGGWAPSHHSTMHEPIATT